MSDNEKQEYTTKPGFLERRAAQYRFYVNRLAEEAWEGCDGCDENDKTFWINGFVHGYMKRDNENEQLQ